MESSKRHLAKSASQAVLAAIQSGTSSHPKREVFHEGEIYK